MPDSGITSIGKYQILGLIGEGAMGVVYRATDSVLNRTVAVKVMSDAIARQSDLRDRFLREAQAAGSLQHPNVVTVYDFGEVDGHLFIAMEYVEGADLEALLALHRPLTLQAKLDLAIGVLNGLAYAHKRGIVHRDVKPANIRVTEEGTAKLMDFGVARLESSEMTRTGMMVGTPSYMSPEQVTGGDITPASDLFAFGAVLYELLGGAKPFDAPTLHGILYKVVSEDPPDLIQLLPGLPPALGRIVRKALAKSVTARYQSAVEMANDLSAVRASLSGPPTAGTLSLRASVETAVAAHRRESSRVQIQRAALVSASTLAVAGIAVLVWSATTRNRGGDDGERAGVVASASPAGAPSPAPQANAEGATSSEPTPSRDAAARQSRATTPAAPATRYAAPTATTSRAPSVAARIHPDSVRVRGQVDSPFGPPAARPPAATAAPASSTSSTSSGGGSSVTASSTAPVVVSPPPSPAATLRTAAPATTLAPPPANPSADVASAVAAYARAIESRDIAAVRRAYPGMSDEQQRGFEEFFAAARSLRVSFEVSGLDVSGPAAEANLVGAYDYVAGGKTEHQPVSFRAALRRDAGGVWRLMSVR